MTKIKLAIITFLWKFKPVWRNYCWGYAVTWAYGGYMDRDERKADHECFYCGSCNTDAEMEKYQGQGKNEHHQS